MKTVLFCNHHVSLIILQDLMQRGSLSGIVMTDVDHGFTREATLIAQTQGIPFYHCSQDELESGLVSWLREISPDAVIVMTFPYKLPAVVLDLPPMGCWNFHMALLPKYRGPDPIFWSLKNGDRHGGLTVHRMVERFDEGPILFRKKVQIADSDVLGTHLNRSAQQAPEGLKELFAFLNNQEGALVEQNPDEGVYFPRPTMEDRAVNWNRMDAREIERLVRASNPTYQGAVAMFRTISVSLHEVEVIQLSDPPNEKPGTIVDAPDNPNLYILCRDSACLWIKVASVPDGVFSGERMRKVFSISSGEIFESPEGAKLQALP